MVNEKHFRRVCGLIDPDKVIFGGQADERAGCTLRHPADTFTKERVKIHGSTR